MKPPARRKCSTCGRRDTNSSTGLCWECRPCPTVETRDGLIHIAGLPPLSTDKALQLAHRLADALGR